MRIADAVADQVTANRSGLGHEASFAAHRARLTGEIAARAPAGRAGRLCLLGAGNANDVDLEALAAAYREVHLVDIDAEALDRARARVKPERQGQLVLHAPLDASGLFDRLDGWARDAPAASSIAAEVAPAVARVAEPLPRGFDVVVSCCLLTQLQLVLLLVVSDRHP